MTQPEGLAARDTPWVVAEPRPPEGETWEEIDRQIIPGISTLKSYSLRNGVPEDIEPYLLTASIPKGFHWSPINGMVPSRAIECVDAFVKVAHYSLMSNKPPEWSNETIRACSILLGAARAVITNNYDVLSSDINPQEMGPPVMSVKFTATGEGSSSGGGVSGIKYTVLAAKNDPNRALLTENFGFTAAELSILKVATRSAQAIIPLQGLNLINDGHHYLSEKSKSSFRAFLAVEKQVWQVPEFKEMMSGRLDEVRDVLWHKAGHPVAVRIKEAAAESEVVKSNLESAKLGSATARLPAMEVDIRTADTYLKVATAVDSVWSPLGGGVDTDVFRAMVGAAKSVPRAVVTLAKPLTVKPGQVVTTRGELMSALKEMVQKNEDKVAMIFGFYCCMVENASNEAGDLSQDSLKSAYSLNRLKRNNIAAYVNGTEMYRDFRAIRNAIRQAPNGRMPKVHLNF